MFKTGYSTFKMLLGGFFAVAILTAAPASVEAAALYWYGNGTILGGSGTWDNTSTGNWSLSQTGGANTP